MTQAELLNLLNEVSSGSMDPNTALRIVTAAPIESDLGFAVVDHHRSIRKGIPEVIFGAKKTAFQIIEIINKLKITSEKVLVTRIEQDNAELVCKSIKTAKYYPLSKTLVANFAIESSSSESIDNKKNKTKGLVAVVCAGTSDLSVAEEAVVTLETFGNDVISVNDVGVAGLHRLLSRVDILRKASVVIVVAGMEGALPSVVAGLVDKPVIAVPTSVGYGTSFGGVAALLSMLNSCSSGISVVNIDNGFGAAYVATLINRL